MLGFLGYTTPEFRQLVSMRGPVFVRIGLATHDQPGPEEAREPLATSWYRVFDVARLIARGSLEEVNDGPIGLG